MLRHDLTLQNLRKGLKNPREAVDKTMIEFFCRVPSTYLNTVTKIGTNVFSREWDLLILLDTCRVDAIQAVADEYDFISEINRLQSVGGRSPEWIAKTFVEEYRDIIGKTAYLSANVFSKQILTDRHHESPDAADVNYAYKLLGRLPTVDVSALGSFEDLSQYEPVGENGPYGHKEGGTPPRYVTDRGIAVGRTGRFDRIILHYLQPHPPYISNALAENRPLELHESDWWSYLKETGDYETIWETYLDELRYVLDEVEMLLDNIDAERVVLSADHGESFGEYWEYGHRTGSLNPVVRTVPWVKTTATDRKSYEPTVAPPTDRRLSEQELNEQLEHLGYKT